MICGNSKLNISSCHIFDYTVDDFVYDSVKNMGGMNLGEIFNALISTSYNIIIHCKKWSHCANILGCKRSGVQISSPRFLLFHVLDLHSLQSVP